MDHLLSQGGYEYKDKPAQIKTILQIPPEKRTTFDVIQLMYLFGDNNFLIRYKETGQLRDLWKHMRYETYEQRDIIFEQDQPGNKFYIVLEGRIAIYKFTDGTLGRHMVRVADYEEGGSFGELALLYGQPRSGQAQALTTTSVLVLDKYIYDQVLSTDHLHQFDKYFNFLRGFPLFHTVQEKTVKHIAQTSILFRYQTDEVIEKQGNMPRKIYFIYTGQVQLHRKLKGQKESILIDTLKGGNSFAEFYVINRQPITFTATTTMPTTIMLFEGSDVQTLGDHAIKEFATQCRPYPNDDQVAGTHAAKQMWNEYKKRLLHNIRLVQKVAKNDFDHSLRKPLMIPKQDVTLMSNDLRNSTLRTGMRAMTAPNHAKRPRKSASSSMNSTLNSINARRVQTSVSGARAGRIRRKHKVVRSMDFEEF